LLPLKSNEIILSYFGIEFKKFGVFGFMDVVKTTSCLGKKYNFVWQHFKDFLVFQKLF
jgi:hypothetical protein